MERKVSLPASWHVTKPCIVPAESSSHPHSPSSPPETRFQPFPSPFIIKKSSSTETYNLYCWKTTDNYVQLLRGDENRFFHKSIQLTNESRQEGTVSKADISRTACKWLILSPPHMSRSTKLYLSRRFCLHFLSPIYDGKVPISSWSLIVFLPYGITTNQI
jgi:hypothetical protein